MPDFVLVDSANKLTVGAEFKPPLQSKREYLTGLGQALSYSRDFHYSALILPSIADDGYPIAAHLADVLGQAPMKGLPIALLSYDPALLSPANPGFMEVHFFGERAIAPEKLAPLDQSFFAKWREISPQEMLRYLQLLYDESRSTTTAATVRDRAFIRLWTEIQAGRLIHWGGGVRHYKDSATNRTAVLKNYRNFLFHVGWVDNSGNLTKEGLEAMHVGILYGPGSRPFLDEVAKSILGPGKHLVLFNAINDYQDSLRQPFPDEGKWLDGLERFLEAKGLLKRNPERAGAAVKGSARQFLKAEKQLWKNLELIVPRSPQRVFHPGRGLIFNWARITDLVQSKT